MDNDERFKNIVASSMQMTGALFAVLIFGLFYFPLITIYHFGKGLADMWIEIL